LRRFAGVVVLVATVLIIHGGADSYTAHTEAQEAPEVEPTQESLTFLAAAAAAAAAVPVAADAMLACLGWDSADGFGGSGAAALSRRGGT
jgi:hypothetical protein